MLAFEKKGNAINYILFDVNHIDIQGKSDFIPSKAHFKISTNPISPSPACFGKRTINRSP